MNWKDKFFKHYIHAWDANDEALFSDEPIDHAQDTINRMRMCREEVLSHITRIHDNDVDAVRKVILETLRKYNFPMSPHYAKSFLVEQKKDVAWFSQGNEALYNQKLEDGSELRYEDGPSGQGTLYLPVKDRLTDEFEQIVFEYDLKHSEFRFNFSELKRQGI